MVLHMDKHRQTSPFVASVVASNSTVNGLPAKESRLSILVRVLYDSRWKTCATVDKDNRPESSDADC